MSCGVLGSAWFTLERSSFPETFAACTSASHTSGDTKLCVGALAPRIVHHQAPRLGGRLRAARYLTLRRGKCEDPTFQGYIGEQ